MVTLILLKTLPQGLGPVNTTFLLSTDLECECAYSSPSDPVLLWTTASSHRRSNKLDSKILSESKVNETFVDFKKVRYLLRGTENFMPRIGV